MAAPSGVAARRAKLGTERKISEGHTGRDTVFEHLHCSATHRLLRLLRLCYSITRVIRALLLFK